MRIGLLGGSFNPAHAGHLHISLLACRRLGLDEVWWLVSPGNPLKPESEMAPFADRFKSAEKITSGHLNIRVSDVECQMGTRYTADTLKALKRRHRGTHFVWLMGADNLASVHRWKHWQDIFGTVPIAVFDRNSYSYGALASVAATKFASARVTARSLAKAKSPAWTFLFLQRHRASATELRKHTGQNWYQQN